MTPPSPSRKSWQETVYLIYSDLYREKGRAGLGLLLREALLGIGVKYCLWMRLTRYFAGCGLAMMPFLVVSKLILRHLSIKYGISVSWKAQIGPGFYIGHFGGIFVSHGAVIGRNCNISQGVTIGINNRGRIGVPAIGDNVYIGPGAKLFGAIKIGNNVAIGANAVVGRNVKSYSIVIPGPVDIITGKADDTTGMSGSAGFINRTDYDAILKP